MGQRVGRELSSNVSELQVGEEEKCAWPCRLGRKEKDRINFGRTQGGNDSTIDFTSLERLPRSRTVEIL